jgi:hypothetical protein
MIELIIKECPYKSNKDTDALGIVAYFGPGVDDHYHIEGKSGESINKALDDSVIVDEKMNVYFHGNLCKVIKGRRLLNRFVKKYYGLEHISYYKERNKSEVPKPGDLIEWKSQLYIAEESNDFDCFNCDLFSYTVHDNDRSVKCNSVFCNPLYRKDKKSIIWKKVLPLTDSSKKGYFLDKNALVQYYKGGVKVNSISTYGNLRVARLFVRRWRSLIIGADKKSFSQVRQGKLHLDSDDLVAMYNGEYVSVESIKVTLRLRSGELVSDVPISNVDLKNDKEKYDILKSINELEKKLKNK